MPQSHINAPFLFRNGKKMFLILFIFFIQLGHSQNKLTEVEKLTATAKVWGFLKYYHPNVADGSQNWNEQLLTILPQIEQAHTATAFSTIIEKWIDSLGEVKNIEINPSSKSVYFNKNFDLSWISKNKLFAKNLSRKLQFIKENRYQGTPYYIAQTEGGNVYLKNDDILEFNWTEKNLRLLAFFRYWNAIEYFFPYKYVMDNNWDKTLTEILPDFITVKNDDDFKLAILKLTVRLNDTHATFHYKTSKTIEKKRVFLPVNFVIIDKKMVVTTILCDTAAKLNDIKIGDVITKFNNKTISTLIEEEKEFVNASNESVYLKNLVFKIVSGYNDIANVEVSRNGSTIKKTIQYLEYNESHCNELQKKKIEKYKILHNNIGYVDLGTLKVSEISEMMSKLDSTQALILDSRNYPKETCFEISKYLNSTVKPFVKYTKPDLSYPGKFIWTEPEVCGTENKNHYKGKVIVLVNEVTHSQAEWATMCFQTAENTTVIGSQTSGADGNTSLIGFISGHDTKFSGIGVYYPNGKETQRIGIIPDIEVKPTVVGIQQGVDEVLERAIHFIEKGK